MRFNLEELMFLQELFNDMKITGRKARHLGRFMKVVNSHVENFQEEQIELLKEVAVLDDNNEILLTKDGQVRFETVDKAKQYQKEITELIQEKRTLLLDEYTKETMIKIILEGEFEIIGTNDAIIYDTICEHLENEVNKD